MLSGSVFSPCVGSVAYLVSRATCLSKQILLKGIYSHASELWFFVTVSSGCPFGITLWAMNQDSFSIWREKK